jgi:hypothetical protein
MALSANFCMEKLPKEAPKNMDIEAIKMEYLVFITLVEISMATLGTELLPPTTKLTRRPKRKTRIAKKSNMNGDI